MARGFGATLGVGATDRVLTQVLAETTTQTWAMWTYRHGDGAGNLGRMWDKVATPVVLSRLSNTAYEFSAGWSTSTSTTATWTVPRPSADAWHHVCVTYDSSSTANDPLIYLDGVATSTTETSAPSGTYVPSTSAYSLGNRASADRNWDGMLAEFAVWNRILAATEIAAIGTKKFTAAWYPSGLMMYVPMIRSLHDYCGTATTATGTLVATHPTNLIYPRVRFTSFTTAATYPGDSPGGGRLTLLGVG